jgi:hypothetical protein
MVFTGTFIFGKNVTVPGTFTSASPDVWVSVNYIKSGYSWANSGFSWANELPDGSLTIKMTDSKFDHMYLGDSVFTIHGSIDAVMRSKDGLGPATAKVVF